MIPPPVLTRQLERRMGDWIRLRLPPALAKLGMFLLEQARLCPLRGLLLLAILLSKVLWQPDWPPQRHDALILFALGVQLAFLRFRLKTLEQARVI